MDVPFPPGREPENAVVADWVEFKTLNRNVPFKRGDLKSAIALENIKAPDLLEERVWQELQTRNAMFADQWPLRLNGSRITRRRPAPVDLTYYRYLLCLGQGLVDSEDRELFELLVTHALAAFTGNPGLHLGAPASPGMDPSFRERVKLYAASAALLDEQEVLSEPLPHDKDLGLDAVAWRQFSDPRSGGLHLLAQCATGADWETKFDDLHLEVWRRHIYWAVAPVRVFSVPFSLTLLPERWVRICAKAGLILDRPRLMELNRQRPLSRHLAAQVRTRLQLLAV